MDISRQESGSAVRTETGAPCDTFETFPWHERPVPGITVGLSAPRDGRECYRNACTLTNTYLALDVCAGARGVASLRLRRLPVANVGTAGDGDGDALRRLARNDNVLSRSQI